MKYWQISPNVQTPKTWFIECEYCKTWDNAHEKEILAKARQLCTKNKHFPEFVISELDNMDHSKMTKSGQMQFLLRIHQESGCDCLDHLFEPVHQATMINYDPDALRAVLTRSTSVPTQGYPKQDQHGSEGATDR